MMRRLLAVAVGAIGLLLLYVAMKPAEYHIEREIAIAAAPNALFPLINNSRLMDTWSPWKEIDPEVVMSYEGPDEGVGAKSTWKSKGSMGAGSATVVESIPNRSVKTSLVYTEPYPMEQTALIAIEPSGEKSVVRWSVDGKNNFMGRLVCLFFDMDAMVGEMFEKGLATLKEKSEAKGASAPAEK